MAQPVAQAQHGVRSEGVDRRGLAQRAQRLRPVPRPHPPTEPAGGARRPDVVVGTVGEVLGRAAGDHLEVRGERVGVGHVDAQREGAAQLRVVGQAREQGLQQGVAGDDVDADGQVRGDLALRGRGVQVSPRQVQRVAGVQHLVEEGLLGGAGADGGGVVVPGLGAQRVVVHRRVDVPALGARDLEDEDVVDVVVRGEPGRRRRGDVGVDLHRVAEVGVEAGREVGDRRPGAVHALEHDGVAVGEERRDAVVTQLVGDLGADPAVAGEVLRVDDGALLGDAQERGAQAPVGEQFVDGVEGEEVAEPGLVGRPAVLGEVVTPGQHGLATPRLPRERVEVARDGAAQEGTVGAGHAGRLSGVRGSGGAIG